VPHQRDAVVRQCAWAQLTALLLTLSLLSLLAGAARAQSAASGSGSCAAVIRAVLADIAGRDLDTSQGPPLNAFLTLNPNAVAQAEALDRRTAAGEPRGPLFCMPVAVKDNFDTYDMPTTVGSLALIGNQPPRDAPFVERLRKAGAIIVGKTNMDEFAMGIRGLSGAGGRVGNAYDTQQSAGGSSSGSAVAVGAGFVPLAVPVGPRRRRLPHIPWQSIRDECVPIDRHRANFAERRDKRRTPRRPGARSL